MGEAEERRLAEAKTRARNLASAIQSNSGFGDWDGLAAAQDEVLAAERDVARTAGDEYADEVDIGLRWDAGAPMPALIADGHRTLLTFYLADQSPGWDRTEVHIVDPTSSDAVPLGVVEFHGVQSVNFGGPNDEVLHGHPLGGRGLAPYGAHQVVNSRWIAAQERINSVHPQHRGGWHDRLHHYLFCFHDETFECLAERITVSRRLAPRRAVLTELAARLGD